MTKARAPRAGTAEGSHRKQRLRKLPKWLKSPEQSDAIARSRCLMVLSVLSGERPVTEAIAQANISRGTYYQLETRAVKAMIAALSPNRARARGRPPDPSERIGALLRKLETLEQDRRRSQRLMALMRKAIRSPRPARVEGWMPTSALLGLMPNGRARWPSSKAKNKPMEDSIPTRDGESAP